MPERSGPWNPLEALPKERRWLWLVVAVWSVVCFGGGLVEALRPGSWRARGLVPGFFQDYASARNYFSGASVYTKHDVTLPLYLGSGARRMATPVVVNAHPPPSVLLALPLAKLEFDNALFVWNLASLVALVISLRLVLRGLGIPLSVWSLAPLTVLVVTCAPLLEQVRQGQQSLVLLLLLTGAWSADRSGRDRLAGGLVGAATAIKLFPGFLLLYYVWRRRWRVVSACVIVLAALCCITAAILGAGSFRDYFLDVMPEIQWFRVGWNNSSVNGFWSRLFDAEPGRVRATSRTDPILYCPTLAIAATIASAAAIAAVLARSTRNVKRRHDEDLAFSMAVTSMLLLSPITWEHYFVLLMVPLGVAWLSLPDSMPARAAFLTTVVFLWVAPPFVWSAFNMGGKVATPLHCVTVLPYQTYALLCLYGLCVGELRRAQADDPATPVAPDR